METLHMATTTTTPTSKQCESLYTTRGFSPLLWGPAMWAILHSAAWAYPIVHAERGAATQNWQIRYRYERFLRSLKYTLPCGACCRNYARLIDKKPIRSLSPAEARACVLRETVLSTRATFSKWLYTLHNCSRRTHGKDRIKTYAQVRAMYGSSAKRRRVWRRHGLAVICYIIWNYPVAPPTGRSGGAREAAYRDLFCALPDIIPRADVPALWGASVALVNNFFLGCSSGGLTGSWIDRETLAVTFIRSYTRARGHTPAAAHKLYADICSYMAHVRPAAT